jgi:hypothetical protein
MNHLHFVFFIIFLFSFSCAIRNDDPPPCGVTATVRNLTGLDGCGYVLELADGKRLIPIRYQRCRDKGLPSAYEEGPIDLASYEGKTIRISYCEATDYATICMAGIPVFISCMSEAGH